MDYKNLRGMSIDDVLNQVQALASVASKEQVQSTMAVLARCTLEVGDRLTVAAAEVDKASQRIGATADEVRSFNESTGALTREVIRLNRILTWATVVIAAGTIAAVAVTILK